MSIRSDICVLTLFELFKVSIHIAIKKKAISIDVFRKKKIARGTPRRKNQCHTCDCTHGTATLSVADARYSVDTVPHVSTDVVRHRAHSAIPSQSQVSSNTRIFLPCRCGAIIRDGAHG
jgi:hypothetical protein